MDMLNKNPLLSSLVALFVGLFIGLVVLGWGLMPVTYENGLPYGLRNDYKKHYVSAVVNAYAADKDAKAVEDRLGGGGGLTPQERAAVLKELKSEVKANDKQIGHINQFATDFKLDLDNPGATAGGGGGSLLGSLMGLLGVLFLLAAVGVLGYFFIQRRGHAEAKPLSRGFTPSSISGTPVTAPQRDETSGTTGVIETEGQEAVLGHFVTTYKLGDDGYDTSFSIETPTGDFLGECGVGIGEVVGEGPQKVTAFEVWLFDKNDIKTVTKVLMSDHAFNNEGIRKKLQSRGDAVMGRTGAEVVLETGALKVTATVSDMAYGSGGTPQSFFSKLTLELAPTIKAK